MFQKIFHFNISHHNHTLYFIILNCLKPLVVWCLGTDIKCKLFHIFRTLVNYLSDFLKKNEKVFTFNIKARWLGIKLIWIVYLISFMWYQRRISCNIECGSPWFTFCSLTTFEMSRVENLLQKNKGSIPNSFRFILINLSYNIKAQPALSTCKQSTYV